MLIQTEKRGSKIVNTGFFKLLVLYLWFLSGLYAFRKLTKSGRTVFGSHAQLFNFLSFFFGPLMLLYLYFQENREFFSFLRHFSKNGSHKTGTAYMNLTFLNSHGHDMFANREDLSLGVNLAKQILYEAITRNASDVFIDPKEDASMIRFRIDGMIRIYDTLLGDKGLSVISVFKVAAGMDIAEKRRPQDGSFSVELNGVNIAFRVASVGVFGGEKITIRIIAAENSRRSLDQLGLTPEQLRLIRSGVKIPSGMILMCGPTGSGKTSTLYSMLEAIDYSMKNVISIEDPVERIIPSISQMEVNVKAGITFSSLLRNALRQNPDIICIGEIRDEETAEIAIHAAQTGHLIIATLHSSDNAGTIVRLTDLGVSLRSIAASLHLIISQRLVRILCPSCKKQTALNQEQLAVCEQYAIPPAAVMSPCGCPVCDHTGYAGRQAIFEILTMTPELRSLMESPEGTFSAIQTYIQKYPGQQSILASTRNMVMNGTISIDEFERVNINI